MTRPIWPAYVINLAANTVRLDHVRRQLEAQNIEFERIEAVLGADLSPAEIARAYDKSANKAGAKQDLVVGEIGCYLSHIAAWTRIAEGNSPGGFVLEDDFAATPDLAEVLMALSAEPQPDWDIAKLICIHDDPKVISSTPLTGRYTLSFPYKIPTMGLGYGLTQASAAALLKRVPPFFRPVDEDHKFFWEHGQRIALVQPNPLSVGEQEAATGTIGDARRESAKGDGRRKRAKGDGWRKLRYQAGYQLRLRWHRLRGMR